MLSNTEEQYLLSKLSHELRNPLTIIYSTLQLIEAQHPETHSFSHWKQLTQNVEYMALLLDELSHLNHAGTLHLSTFSFQHFIQYISLSFAATIATADIQYSSYFDPSIHQITGDKTKLQEVFFNLLRNAADATRPGGAIKMTAEKSNDSIIVSITDTGCGITPEQLDTIFEPFVTYKKNGTGLGLSISQSIVHAHHGELEVVSLPGQGATFRVILPANQGSDKKSCK